MGKTVEKGHPKGTSDEQYVLPRDCQFGRKEDFNLNTPDVRVDFAQQSYNIPHMRSRRSCVGHRSQDWTAPGEDLESQEGFQHKVLSHQGEWSRD